jgi:deoxyribonuclease V
MRPTELRDWPHTPREGIALQLALRDKVETHDRFGEIRRVAGLDVGFESDGRTVRAAVAVLAYPSLAPIAHAIAHRPVEFPYVPGLLSFRETPALLDALAKLDRKPDLLLCDAHGFAHPRRFGLACHIGVLTGIPSIGVAKTLLVGTHAAVPAARGAHRPIRDRGETIGAALRTRTGVAPVYVSIGHRVSLESAIAFVLACAPRYRLPETTRAAHRLASGN